MKAEKLRKKTNSDLAKLLEKDKEKLRNLRFDLSTGKLKKIKEIERVKREIARILTILKQKQNA